MLLLAFVLLLDCQQPNRCDVRKADDAVASRRFAAPTECEAFKEAYALRGGRYRCINASSVACYNDGSICTFMPVDEEGWRYVKRMIPMSD